MSYHNHVRDKLREMKITEIFALNTKLHNFSFTKEKFRENIQYNLARVLNSTLISRFFATLNMMRAAQSVKKTRNYLTKKYFVKYIDLSNLVTSLDL